MRRVYLEYAAYAGCMLPCQTSADLNKMTTELSDRLLDV